MCALKGESNWGRVRKRNVFRCLEGFLRTAGPTGRKWAHALCSSITAWRADWLGDSEVTLQVSFIPGPTLDGRDGWKSVRPKGTWRPRTTALHTDSQTFGGWSNQRGSNMEVSEATARRQYWTPEDSTNRRAIPVSTFRGQDQLHTQHISGL